MNHPSSFIEDNIILGADPGTLITGYGVIRIVNQKYIALDYGCIRPPASLKLSERYLIIFESIEKIIDKYAPKTLAIESQYIHKNSQSALKLGMAKGVVMTAAKKKGLSVFEYAPTLAKRAVVGNGKASKFQVQGMVQRILNLSTFPQPDDAADALALAICHAHALSRFQPAKEI